MLRTKNNEELFSLYKAELALRIRNQRNLSRYRQVLDQFQEFLADNPPSSMLAKSFLSKWAESKAATLYKYLVLKSRTKVQAVELTDARGGVAGQNFHSPID